MSEAALQARLQRAERKVQLLESMIEDKTRELYRAMRKLERSERELRQVTEAVPAAVLAFRDDGRISMANGAAARLLGLPGSELIGQPLASFFQAAEAPSVAHLAAQGLQEPVEGTCLSRDGEPIAVLKSWAAIENENGEPDHGVVVLFDIRSRRRLEVELRQSQKLEAVGRLAAGVAHEINTPAQFVNDSIHFLRDSSNDIAGLMAQYRWIAAQAAKGQPVAELIQAARTLEEEIDLEYIVENVPLAFDRAVDGMGRVTSIVRSMKQFAHPDTHEMTAVDLNSCVDSVLTIARNEYKYIADVSTTLGALPRVTCHAGEINQVLLNLVVNAAHAIEERHAGSGQRGTIGIRTALQDDGVRISISDDGVGIPGHLRDRIFDPFFTTKAVGKGTGQGLAFARTMVVDRHGGRIELESTPGQGSTFHLLLPLVGVGARQEASA